MPMKGFKRLNTYTLRNHGDKRALNAHLLDRDKMSTHTLGRTRTCGRCAEMSVTNEKTNCHPLDRKFSHRELLHNYLLTSQK